MKDLRQRTTKYYFFLEVVFFADFLVVFLAAFFTVFALATMASYCFLGVLTKTKYFSINT